MNTNYAQPIVSIDVVPIRRNKGVLSVALGARKYEPFIGQLALPGVLLGHETLVEAAHRALEQKTGIRKEDVISLIQVSAFDNPDRDPRGATLSIAFLAVIRQESDSADANWYNTESLPVLPFDHNSIVAKAIEQVGFHLWKDESFTRSLLAPTFSTSEAAQLTESTSNSAVDRTNFARNLKNYPSLQVQGTAPSGSRSRPATRWGFTE